MRPLKYGEKLISIPTRVPESAVKEFNVLVREFLKKYEVGCEIANSSPKTPKPEFINAPVKPKWQIDAEQRMKRNKTT